LAGTGATALRSMPAPAVPVGSMDLPPFDGRVRNRLLRGLPAEDMALVRRHLELVSLQPRESLFKPGASIRYVYFPETAVVSLLSAVGNATVEVGTAGSEGMAGLPAFLADDTSSLRAFAQIPGVAGRMDVGTFTLLAAPPGPLHGILLRYAQAFLMQVAQTAACNAAHLVEERCARWLLMTRDRVDGDELQLTPDFLAFMLGVRRTGVTAAMSALRQAGLVDYAGGRVTVLDRRGLEGASCECYRAVRAHFERLLPPAADPRVDDLAPSTARDPSA
jgi:CRP-like cAMP-binding protein